MSILACLRACVRACVRKRTRMNQRYVQSCRDMLQFSLNGKEIQRIQGI